MYEGKNIHYSPADQKPLCSFSGKVCRQRRLNGYALCLRHILEDPSAPYKRCANLAKNGLQCSNIIPQSRKTDYCNSHMQVHTAANLPFQPPSSAGFALQSLAKSQQSANGLSNNPDTSGSCGAKGRANVINEHINGPRPKKKVHKGLAGSSSFSLASEDPYAFPSDPDPPKARKPAVSYNNMSHPFPNLSQALANLATGAKHGQPHVYEPPRTESTSSIARFFPELVEKLDIGKNNKLKADSPPKAKIPCLSSLSNNKSSRTMNRLQTKIAQNKIKDKLKRSSIANSSSNSSQSSDSPNSAKPSQPCSSNTGRKISTSSTTSSVELDSETSSKKPHISNIHTAVSSHKASAKNRSSRTKSRSKSSSACPSAENAAPVVRGLFPGAENSLQCTLINPWTHPGVGSSPSKGEVAGLSLVEPLFSASSSFVTEANSPSCSSPERIITRPCSSNSQSVCKTVVSTHSITTSYEGLSAQGLPSSEALSGMPSIPPSLSTPQGLPISNTSGVSPRRIPSALSLPPNVAIPQSPVPHGIPPSINLLSPNTTPVKDDTELLRCYTSATYRPMAATALTVVPPGSDVQNHTNNTPVLEPADAKALDSRITPIITTVSMSGNVTAPSSIKVRQYKERFSLSTARRKVKHHSAMKLYYLYQKRKRNNINLFPMGIDSSEEDESDVEEVLPYQQEWLLSSSDSEKDDDDMVDDPLLANIRHTKQALLHAKLRRRFTQANKAYDGNACVHSSHLQDLSTLVTAARTDPSATVESLNLVLHEDDTPGMKPPGSILLRCRPCLCKTSEEKLCGEIGLPFTNQCGKHIMYNVEQQLYDYCTAKFSDNTQCCIPVFDIKHELPLCPEHAAKAENYQKNLEANRPKKPRKKTKPSALTRPPKKGKKKKNQRKNKPPREMSPVMVNSNSSAILTTDEMSADDNTDLTSDLPVPSSPESKGQLENDLGNDLEESFSPGTIDKHLELPLGEHDLNEVLNKLPVDAFELFGKNGDFAVNSKVEEEAAAFEHVLAETSKKLKASESLSQVSNDANHSIAMMIADHSNMMNDDHNNMISSHGNLMASDLIDEHGHEDDLTKEIADSILQQNLSPTGSIVDDLGQDNISALASSLSVSDLRNISQVLNASLINQPGAAGDLSTTAYGHTSVSASIQDQTQHLLSTSNLENGSNSFPYTPMVPAIGLHDSVGNIPHPSDSNHQFISAVQGHAVSQSVSQTASQEGSYVGQQTVPVNGASSTQSIAQILAALTAGAKQFTNAAPAPDTPMRANSGQHFPPVVNLDHFLQVPLEGSMGTTGSAMSVNNIQGLQSPITNTAGLLANNQYITVPTSQAIPMQQQTLNMGPKPVPTSLQNGLLTFPTTTQQQLTIGSATAPLGLKLTCPVQTLMPVGLLGSTLPQGLPSNMVPTQPTMIANHGQPMVAMTNATQIIPHPAAQYQSTTNT